MVGNGLSDESFQGRAGTYAALSFRDEFVTTSEIHRSKLSCFDRWIWWSYNSGPPITTTRPSVGVWEHWRIRRKFWLLRTKKPVTFHIEWANSTEWLSDNVVDPVALLLAIFSSIQLNFNQHLRKANILGRIRPKLVPYAAWRRYWSTGMKIIPY